METVSILNHYKDLCSSFLEESATKLTKSFKSFIVETFILYLVIPGRINFLQLGRYGDSCEGRFRRNYSADFDWLSYNLSISRKILTGDRKAIAIDPSFITKSGKQTPWVGYFWSGCAGAVKRGLEILGIGLIDVDNKDCLSLQAIQTPDSTTLESRDKTLMDWYVAVLERFKDKLLAVTSYMVADAYFSKSNFVLKLQGMGFHLVSRLRDDAVLFYPTLDQPTGKRGRPKQYDGRIQMEHPDWSRMQKMDITLDQGELYSMVAYCRALKQLVRLVIWFSKDKKKWKLYFSTNCSMSGKDVIEYYRTRFQIEFCFRDAKQFTGLNHCQARDVDKLSFHFNASLTCVNQAKALTKEMGIPFSMTSIKTMMHNAFMLQRFIRVSGIRPNKILNDKLIKELIEFAAVAA